MHPSSLNKWFFIISLILYLLALTGFGLAFIFGGVGYAIKSLIYVIPAMLSPIMIFILWKSNSKKEIVRAFTKRVNFIHLVLMAILLLVVSIIMLVFYPTRPWAYFVVISLISGLIFAQIIYKRSERTDYVIVFEIILLSLNLLWGVSLKYPLYFGYTDILSHLSFIQTVVQTGHTTGINISYLNFPLFHIFNAIGIELTTLSLRNCLFVLIGISWQIGILFAYLIFKQLSNSRMFSLIACLLFALSSDFIFYGTYTVTRSLDFIVALGLLYLIMKKPNIKYIFLSLIAISTVILIHHATVLFFIPVLIILYIFQSIFNKNKSAESQIEPIAIQLLIICFFAYVFYFAYSFSIPVAQGIMESLKNVDVYGPSGTTSGTSLILIYYSFVFFFYLVGIGKVFFNRTSDNAHRSNIGTALATIVFLVFYLPGPLDLLPQSKITLLYRLPILVSPFIIYFAAHGLDHLVSFEQSFVRHNLRHFTPIPFLTLSLVVIMTFFSIISGSNADDNQYILKASKTDSKYFTNAELAAFSFVKSDCSSNSNLYGDLETMLNTLYFKDFLSRQIITGGDISYIVRGYIIFRSGELQKTGGLSLAHSGLITAADSTNYRYFPEQTNPQTDLLANLSSKACVYSDGDVQLFAINQTGNSSH